MDISESILQIRQLINVPKPFNKKEKILILDALLTDDITSDKKSNNINKINGANESKRGRRANLDQDTKEEQKNFVKDYFDKYPTHSIAQCKELAEKVFTNDKSLTIINISK
jgi:hypothetical protein